MGGHGALTLYLASLTNSKQYRSASAFSPICNPTKAPWGEKAFKGYLIGGVEEAKGMYDATDLIAKIKEPVHILIDYVCLTFIADHTVTRSHMIPLPAGLGHSGQFFASVASRNFFESGPGSRTR